MEETTKFTPGPWYPLEYAGYWQIQSGPYYNDPDLLNEEDVLTGLAQHNAQLAAAAPDLYKALKLAMETPQNEWDGDKRAFCLAALNSAINK